MLALKLCIAAAVTDASFWIKYTIQWPAGIEQARSEGTSFSQQDVPPTQQES
jgi:hypothetical protein